MVTPPQPRSGRTLARRYHLLRVLGRGAMGAVWEAEDTVLRRPVAVKEVVLPSGLSPQERAVSCERTLREARAIARLGHPNVVTLFDVLDEDSRPWVVMELVPSRSLADTIKTDGPLHPLRVATVGLAILGALEAAHTAGITHRDVKPGNILLGHDGRVKLTDFGIARAAGDDTITGTGLLVGSPSYIAPEIVKGQAVGPPADLWGLGATLYAAAEGRAPFSGVDAMDTLAKVVQEPPAPYERSGPLVPALTAMLDKDPILRATPVDARRLLLDVLRGGTDSEHPAAGPVPPPLVPAAALAAPVAAAGQRPGLAELLVPVRRDDGGWSPSPPPEPPGSSRPPEPPGSSRPPEPPGSSRPPEPPVEEPTGGDVVPVPAAGAGGGGGTSGPGDPADEPTQEAIAPPVGAAAGTAEPDATDEGSAASRADGGEESTGTAPVPTRHGVPADPGPDAGAAAGPDAEADDRPLGTPAGLASTRSRAAGDGPTAVATGDRLEAAAGEVGGPAAGGPAAGDLFAASASASPLTSRSGPWDDSEPASGTPEGEGFAREPRAGAGRHSREPDPAGSPEDAETAGSDEAAGSHVPPAVVAAGAATAVATGLGRSGEASSETAAQPSLDEAASSRAERRPAAADEPTAVGPPLDDPAAGGREPARAQPTVAAHQPGEAGATVAIPAGQFRPPAPGATAVLGRHSPPGSGGAGSRSGGSPAVDEADRPTRLVAPLPFGAPVGQGARGGQAEPGRVGDAVRTGGPGAAGDSGGSGLAGATAGPPPGGQPPSPPPFAFLGERTPADRRRRTVAALLAVAALLLAAVLGVVLLLTSLGGDSSGPPGAAGRSTSAAAAPAKIPAGYTRYEGNRTSVAVPTGWTAAPVRTGVVDLKEGDGSRFLRLITVDSTKSALDQLTGAEQQFAANPAYAPYRRIRLEKVSYRGYDTADWEFTFTSRNSLRHVLYRGVVAGGHSYGLYLSVPDSRWAESQAVFRTAAETFRPAAGG